VTLGERIRENRSAILGVTTILALCGIWAAARMPTAIFPELTFQRIAIIARAGNLPVEQTLTTLTQPLEGALSGVIGVTTIRSVTSRGGVELDLRFDQGTDMFRALQLTQAATEQVRGELPSATLIEARLLDTSTFPILAIAVTSKQRSLAELSDFAIYEAAPELRSIPGVQRVELNGAKIREYSLTVNPDALVRHRLELGSVEAAVRKANLIGGGGSVRDGPQLVLTVVDGGGTTLLSLPKIVVAQDQGIPVTLGEVATIESSVREDFTRASANGQSAVLIGISRQPSGSTVAISARAEEIVADLRRAHPDLEFANVYDQAYLVHQAVTSVRDSVLIGLCLAVATTFFFIADVRSTLIAGLVIPTTIAITAIVLRGLGMSFNLMTLGAVAAGIGLILDDAIVVIESFHRTRAAGRSAGEAVVESMSAIGHALVGSTLTPVAVLLPLGWLGGVAGDFFRPLAITMTVSLLLSLVLALSFTPALLLRLDPGAHAVRHGPGERLAERIATVYARALRWMLAHAAWGMLALCVLAAAAWLSYRHVQTGFIPMMDEGAFILDYWAPPGTSLEETTALLARVDDILRDTPEVAAFSRRTGAELGFFLTDANRGDYSVRLVGGKRRQIEEVIDDVRGRVEASIPGLRVEFVQILQDMIGDLSGDPNPVEIKLFGRDFTRLEPTAKAANEAIEGIAGIVDNFDGIDPIGPTFRVDVDEVSAGRVDLNGESVQSWLATATDGAVVGQVLEGDRAIPLRLRYPDDVRARLDATTALTLVAPQGRLAPLRSIALLRHGEPSIRRARENLRQLVRVTAQISGRDLGSVTRDVQRAIREKLSLPPGVTVEYGGLYASQQRAFGELAAALGASLLGVFALLLLEFGSVAAATAIVAGSILALSGSLLTLWVTHTALNVSSLVGMIMVVGIVAKNGILLIDHAIREERRATSRFDALVHAGRVRLRPILMTSTAAGAGLLPLALGWGAGSEMQQPLAIAILGGLSLSMLFSLVGVPLAYLRLSRSATEHSGDASAGR
jgi:CzcA family heavy metal efflux pump